ncbi:hypothetical protein OpiT1DRAFT_03909 [Opitutaceae bacterium TAV1]|nr:hypothetical protein OpiT1DRAFT_03909 [Opitutaceae bacterium TAV1]
MATALAQIHLKASPGTKSFLQMAAELSGAANLTDYILRAAITRAREDIAEHRTFALSDEAWAVFEQRLEAPVRELPHLCSLLNSPDVFDRPA